MKKNFEIEKNMINAVYDDRNINWKYISFQNDIEIQKWTQYNNIMSCEIFFTEAETQKISVKQKQMTKKFSIININ